MLYFNCSALHVVLCITLCPFLFCNHLNGEERERQIERERERERERAGCFALFVYLVSRVCSVALLDGARG